MVDNPDNYFKEEKVIDFEIIYHECPGLAVIWNIKKKTVSAIFRNTKRDDLWVR